MKKSYFIFLLIAVTWFSCKKETPPATLNVILGYNSELFPNYKQDTIKFNRKDSILAIQIVEDNLRNFQVTNTNPDHINWVNNIAIKTSQDDEVFIKDKNCLFAGGGFGSNQINGTWYSSNSIILLVPIKFTNSIKRDDNVIELLSPKDTLRIFYISKFTNNTIEKQVIVKVF